MLKLLLLSACFVSSLHGASIIVTDFKQVEATAQFVNELTGGLFYFPLDALCPGCGNLSPFINLTIEERDTRIVRITRSVPVISLSIITVSTPASWQLVPPTPSDALDFFRATTDPISIFNITAVDRNPTGSDLSLLGFSPRFTQLLPVTEDVFFTPSSEIWIGKSGATFSAPIDDILVRDLLSSLNDPELTRIFAGGEPIAPVYVSSISAPFQEFGTAVETPEPAAWILFAGAAAGLLGYAGSMIRPAGVPTAPD